MRPKRAWRDVLWGVLVVLAGTTAVALEKPVPVWTRRFAEGANPYYLNDNMDGDAVLIGQIGFGVRSLGIHSNQFHALWTTNLMPGAAGAKCMARLGDHYYVCHHDAGGIARFAVPEPWTNAWDGSTWEPAPPAAIDPIDPATGGGTGPESIVSDGAYLYTNDDHNRARIHCFLVGAAPFALTHQWSADLPAGGRVRGLTYHPSGYLYMHNGAASADDTTLYAVRLSDRQVFNMGTHVEGALVYQVLRYGDELLVFGLGETLTVYDLASDTEIAPGGPKHQYRLGVGALYGAAMVDDYLFVSHPGSVSLFRIPPPGTLFIIRGPRASE